MLKGHSALFRPRDTGWNFLRVRRRNKNQLPNWWTHAENLRRWHSKPRIMPCQSQYRVFGHSGIWSSVESYPRAVPRRKGVSRSNLGQYSIRGRCQLRTWVKSQISHPGSARPNHPENFLGCCVGIPRNPNHDQLFYYWVWSGSSPSTGKLRLLRPS